MQVCRTKNNLYIKKIGGDTKNQPNKGMSTPHCPQNDENGSIWGRKDQKRKLISEDLHFKSYVCFICLPLNVTERQLASKENTCGNVKIALNSTCCIQEEIPYIYCVNCMGIQTISFHCEEGQVLIGFNISSCQPQRATEPYSKGAFRDAVSKAGIGFMVIYTTGGKE